MIVKFLVSSIPEAFDGSTHFGNGFYELKTVFVLRLRSCSLTFYFFCRESFHSELNSEQEMKFRNTTKIIKVSCSLNTLINTKAPTMDSNAL